MFHAPSWDARKSGADDRAHPDVFAQGLFSAGSRTDGAADSGRTMIGNQAHLRRSGDESGLFASPPSQTIALPALQIVPIDARAAPALIPRAGAASGEVDLAPNGNGGGAGPAPAPQADADSCAVPRSMEKVTSGAFLGGLDVGSYYPDLAARNYPTTAGPFDLGDRVGSSVQFIGAIPSPCRPDQFTLGQTASVTRLRVNGTPHQLEGQTVDDLKRSGRDIAHTPFRQEFLGGGKAPLGYIISMLDPPSIPYDASTNSAEFDVSFVSSLAGSGGSKSVSWSISVRVANGKVTKNTVA